MATETIIQREAPEVEAYKLGLLKSAKELADKPLTLPQQKIAAMSGLQGDALKRAQAGLGSYQPFLNQAGQTMGGAGTAYDQGIAGLSGVADAYDPSSYQEYMNPYEDAAVQQALADIQRAGDVRGVGLDNAAVSAGAFGGSRSGIQRAELDRSVIGEQARTASGMRAAGYESAAQRAQAAFEAQKQRAISGSQVYGQLGQGLGNLGGQQASLGQLGQQLGQQDATFGFEMGKYQQAQQQAELEAQRANELQQMYEPYQRTSYLSDIYKGAPSSQSTITQTSAPSVSPAQSFLGLGIAGLSAATGARTAGLF